MRWLKPFRFPSQPLPGAVRALCVTAWRLSVKLMAWPIRGLARSVLQRRNVIVNPIKLVVFKENKCQFQWTFSLLSYLTCLDKRPAIGKHINNLTKSLFTYRSGNVVIRPQREGSWIGADWKFLESLSKPYFSLYNSRCNLERWLTSRAICQLSLLALSHGGIRDSYPWI